MTVSDLDKKERLPSPAVAEVSYLPIKEQEYVSSYGRTRYSLQNKALSPRGAEEKDKYSYGVASEQSTTLNKYMQELPQYGRTQNHEEGQQQQEPARVDYASL